MIEDVNPFVYSRPVPPEDVVDRDEEVAELLRSAVGGHYVRLYAPRKYGKTSLREAPPRRASRTRGGVPPAHGRRALPRGVRDQRAAPARPGARSAARAP